MGLMQRFQAPIKAAKLILGSGGVVDAATGATLVGGAPLDGLVAHASGGRASATQLQYGMNRVITVANAADSVALPPAVKGAQVILINDGASAAQVFAVVGSTDTIDGIAAATGVALTNAKRDIFYCLTAGAWQSLLGGKSA